MLRTDGTDLFIGETYSGPDKVISFVKVGNMLIADRNLLVNASRRTQTKNSGLTYIDGAPHSVRLLTGGKNKLDTNDEWHQILLSFPDVKERFQIKEMFTWCHNAANDKPSYRAVRVYGSVGHWDYDGASYQYANVSVFRYPKE